MERLRKSAEAVAAALRARKATVAVAESARVLGLRRTTLGEKMRRLNIHRMPACYARFCSPVGTPPPRSSRLRSR